MKLDKYTIGKRYGKAVFELAVENNELEVIYKELSEIKNIFNSIVDLGDILTDDRLSPTEKDQVFNGLVNQFEGTTRNFLHVVYEYRRMDDMILIIEEFEKRYNQKISNIQGVIRSVIPLDNKQKSAAEEKLANMLGYKTAELTNIIDESLIGGVIIEANNYVIDGSVRKAINDIRKKLVL